MKIVINDCYGWFGLSAEGLELYNKLSKKQVTYSGNIERDDKNLIKVVEELGDNANGSCANLVIIQIPDGVNWEIEEYDGLEHVAEAHRTWWGE